MASPQHELVDLIDEQGRTVGVVTRQEMRAQRLRHRCVYLLVFDHQGQLFIHQRTSSKDVFPAYWDLTVGGVLTAGETFDQGAIREGEEELGVAIQPTALFPIEYADERTVVHGMVYHVHHDGPFTLQASEIAQGRFIPIDELDHWMQVHQFCPDGIEVWKEYASRGGSVGL